MNSRCRATQEGHTRHHRREPDPTTEQNVQNTQNNHPHQGRNPQPNQTVHNGQYLTQNENPGTLQNNILPETHEESANQEEEEQWDQIPNDNNLPQEPDEIHGPANTPRNKKKGKNNRANLRIASLNMKWYGSSGQETKWQHINQLIRDSRIGVLAIQETHMDEDQCKKMESQFGRRLQIIASADPNSPT